MDDIYIEYDNFEFNFYMVCDVGFCSDVIIHNFGVEIRSLTQVFNAANEHLSTQHTPPT